MKKNPLGNSTVQEAIVLICFEANFQSYYSRKTMKLTKSLMTEPTHNVLTGLQNWGFMGKSTNISAITAIFIKPKYSFGEKYPKD